MDPSIMKLLEEDEDESMHSGADVEAFQAALNRDLGGDASASQSSNLESVISHGQEGSHGSNQPAAQWKNTSAENTNFQYSQGSETTRMQEQHSSDMDLKQHGTGAGIQHHQNVSVSHMPLQQKLSQEESQKGRSGQIPSQIPQSTGFQMAEKNPMSRTEPDRMHNHDGESQLSKAQKMTNQPGIGGEQSTNTMKAGKQVPFAMLLPTIMPSLDKDRAMQLHTLYNKLKRNEITKDVFVRHMRDIVGDQMLKLAVSKMQAQLQPQVSARQQQVRMPSSTGATTQFADTNSFGQFHQKGANPSVDSAHMPASSGQMPVAQKPLEPERQSGSHGMHGSQISSSSSNTIHQERERSSVPLQGLNKQQQQHLHFPQTSFSMYGGSGGNYHPYSGTNLNPSGASMRPHPHDSQMRQISHQQNMGSASSGSSNQAMNVMNVPKFERPNSTGDPTKLLGGPHAKFTNNSGLQQSSVPWQATPNKEQSSGPLSPMTYVKMEQLEHVTEQQHKTHSSTPHGLSAVQTEPGNAIPGSLKDEALEKQSPRTGFSSSSMSQTSSISPSTTTQTDPNVPLNSRMPSVTTAGTNARTPPKKPSIGQKKPLEALGSSPPPSSKKQKVSGAFSDQSIEQLNDVTAVSGVNLREEEEQLFSGPKEDSRVSEASRRVVQEEEDRLILQKSSLQKRLAEIMAKCGLKNLGSDVERCLSLCVEERMRGLLSSLIRLSKQRVDAEKSRHRAVITSDVRQQILSMNRRAREEWEKKQAEAEKIRKLNEPESENEVDGDKEKDEGRGKLVKGNKEDDDKMRTTAANVAARAAVGGDDMLSKWQLMAEQARQKREGATDAAAGSQAGKDVNRKTASTSGRNMKDGHESERRGQGSLSSTGAGRKFGKNQATSHNRVTRTVSIKDLIALLEREPQMSKSTLVYRLYERMHSDTAAE